MKKLFFLFFVVFAAPVALAQVTIAPTNLFIDSGNRFGTYMVINGSNQNQEISIDFQFAYSQTNAGGEKAFVPGDSTIASRHSVAEHIRAFPQNFVLAPGQRQIVRIRVNAPNTIPDGTYWARIRTASTPESPPVEMTSNEGVTARVGITFEQITGLFYKKGQVSTGIEVENISTQMMDDGQLAVLTKLKRTGNSPFLGSITTSLLDAQGKSVRDSFISTSIYFDETHRQYLNLNDLQAGNYTIQVKFEAQRNDISSTDLVQMEPVIATIPYTIR